MILRMREPANDEVTKFKEKPAKWNTSLSWVRMIIYNHGVARLGCRGFRCRPHGDAKDLV
jgi:hypothetical protein